MKSVALVALGGGLGSVLRYAVGLGLSRFTVLRVPLGTLVVNVVGAFFLGLVVANFAERGIESSASRNALTVGLLGGFTTYSAFALEVVLLARARDLLSLSVYITALMFLSLAGCALGLYLGKSLA